MRAMILYQVLGYSGGSKSNSSSIQISGWIVISRNQATAKRLQRYVADPEYQLCDSSFVCDAHWTTCLGGNVHPMTRLTGLVQNRNTCVQWQDIQCNDDFRICQKFIPSNYHCPFDRGWRKRRKWWEHVHVALLHIQAKTSCLRLSWLAGIERILRLVVSVDHFSTTQIFTTKK